MRLPVKLMKQPYKVLCPAPQPGKFTEVDFDILRVQSAVPQYPFSFSVVWPHMGPRRRSPLATLISNVDGKSYLAWTWGRKWFYVARLGAGNTEDEVLDAFLTTLSRSGEKEAGAGVADPHEYPGFGLSAFAAAINLEEVLSPELLRHCKMATGALGLRVKAIRSLADECLAIRIHDLSDRRVFEIHGQGTQWNLVEHFLIESQTLSSKSSHGPKDGDFPDF